MDPALLSALSGLLGALASAGPWALLAATAIGIGVGLQRKWWVPGWLYEDMELRLKAALAQAEVSASMTKELTDIVTTALVRRGDWMDAPSRGYPPSQRRVPRSPAKVDRRERD